MTSSFNFHSDLFKKIAYSQSNLQSNLNHLIRQQDYLQTEAYNYLLQNQGSSITPQILAYFLSINKLQIKPKEIILNGYLIMQVIICKQKKSKSIEEVNICNWFVEEWGGKKGSISLEDSKKFLLPYKIRTSKTITNKKAKFQTKLANKLIQLIQNQLQNIYQIQILKTLLMNKKYFVLDKMIQEITQGEDKIQQKQFRKFAKRKGIILNKQQISSLFNRLDKEQNGILSKQQLINYFHPKMNFEQYQQYYVQIKFSNFKLFNSQILNQYQVLSSQFKHPQQSQLEADVQTPFKRNKWKQNSVNLISCTIINRQQHSSIQEVFSFLKKIIESERNLDELRKEIWLNENFNLLLIFIVMDREKKKKISFQNFVKFLNSLDIHLNCQYAKNIFKRYVKFKNMIFTQFCYMMLPNQIQYLNLISTRKPISLHKTPEFQSIQQGVLSKLRQFFTSLIASYQQMLKSVRQFQKLNIEDLFEIISQKKRITVNSIKNFYESYNKIINSQQLVFLFKRLDKTQSGTIKKAFFFQIFHQ